MTASVPNDPTAASDEEVLVAIKNSSKGIIIAIKKIDEETGLNNLNNTLESELKALLQDAHEIFEHIREAEEHDQVDHNLVEGLIRDEQEMESIEEDLKNQGSSYAMGIGQKLSTLEKYTKELGRRINN